MYSSTSRYPLPDGSPPTDFGQFNHQSPIPEPHIPVPSQEVGSLGTSNNNGESGQTSNIGRFQGAPTEYALMQHPQVSPGLTGNGDQATSTPSSWPTDPIHAPTPQYPPYSGGVTSSGPWSDNDRSTVDHNSPNYPTENPTRRNTRDSDSPNHSSLNVPLTPHRPDFDSQSINGHLPSRTLKGMWAHLDTESSISLAMDNSYLAIATRVKTEVAGRVMILNTANGNIGHWITGDITHFELHSIQNRDDPILGRKTWVIAAGGGHVSICDLNDSLHFFNRCSLGRHWKLLISYLKPIPGHPFAVIVLENVVARNIHVQVFGLESLTIYHQIDMSGSFTSLDVFGKRLAICTDDQCQIWDWHGKKLIHSFPPDHVECVSFVNKTHLLVGAKNGEIQFYSTRFAMLISQRKFASPPQALGKPRILSIKIIQEADMAVCKYAFDQSQHIMMCFYRINNGKGTLEKSEYTGKTTIFAFLPNKSLVLLHADYSSSDVQVVDISNQLARTEHFRHPLVVYQMGYFHDCIAVLVQREKKFFVRKYRFSEAAGTWERVCVVSSDGME